jgi:hypothetical protein
MKEWPRAACWLLLAVAIVITRGALAGTGAGAYEIGVATILGGSEDGQVRDVAVDSNGNVCVAGGTGSADFPTTVGPEHQGWYDVFVTKFNPDGEILWSRLVGGPDYDRAYAIEIDGAEYVCVGDRAGPGYPTTGGVLQGEFGGDANPNRAYGPQDGFVTKLSPDGADVIWSTYFGGDDRSFFRDIDIDRDGNVYGALCTSSVESPHITPDAFSTERPEVSFGVITKMSSDGRRVIWANYLGGTDGGYATGTPSIRVDRDGCAVVATTAAAADVATTEGAHDRQKDGPSDMYIARFSPDGSSLASGSYLGGSDIEYGGTHNLALGPDGSIVVAATTKSADFPVTPGAFQTSYGGSGGWFDERGDGFIARLSPSGELMAATFYGGNSGDGLEGVQVDAEGACTSPAEHTGTTCCWSDLSRSPTRRPTAGRRHGPPYSAPSWTGCCSPPTTAVRAGTWGFAQRCTPTAPSIWAGRRVRTISPR